MSLSLSTQPGFTEIADSSWDGGNVPSDSLLKSLNSDVKFGAVRNEQFYGYYANGESIVLPVSPADGYVYSRAELLYSWSVFWTGSASGGTGGAMTAPTGGPTTGQGTPLQMQYNVDQATGLVRCYCAYFKTSQQDTNDGILCVITHAQRNR